MKNKLMKFYEINCPGVYYAIRKKISSRKERQIAFIVLTPLLLILAFFSYISSVFFEYSHSRKTLLDERNQLSVAAILKDEGLYIKEWIEYYISLGVSRLYIYDNESTDNIKELLQRYIDSGTVIYTYWPGRAKQLDAYMDALRRDKGFSKYIMFLDLDEFIVSYGGDGFISEVDKVFSEYEDMAALAVNWRVFGSAGHVTKPSGNVKDNFLYRAKDDAEPNRLVKLIARPTLVKIFNNPHWIVPKRGFVVRNEKGLKMDGPSNPYPNNSYEKFSIHHYYCKSQDETKIKFARGLATDEVDIKRKWSEFERFDLNDVYDPTLLNK